MANKRAKPQVDLFAQPRYVIDTSSILNFWKKTADEPYGLDVFEGSWGYIDEQMGKGLIIAPEAVKAELAKWTDRIPELEQWLKDRAVCFQPKSTEQYAAAAVLINRYKKYSTDKVFEADLMVSAMAMAYGIDVISSEQFAEPHSLAKPKIPNVCDENGVHCHTPYEFFQKEGLRFVLSPAPEMPLENTAPA